MEFFKDLIASIFLFLMLVSATVFGSYTYDKYFKKKEKQTIIFNYKCEVKTNAIQSK